MGRLIKIISGDGSIDGADLRRRTADGLYLRAAGRGKDDEEIAEAAESIGQTARYSGYGPGMWGKKGES